MANLHRGIVRPKQLADFLAHHHFAGMLQQNGQNAEGLLLQPHAATVAAQFGGSQVEFKIGKARDARRAKAAGGHRSVLPL